MAYAAAPLLAALLVAAVHQLHRRSCHMATADLIPARRSRTPTLHGDTANPWLALHHEMNRLFDDFWQDFEPSNVGQRRAAGWPNMELSETDKELKVVAELPGVDEKDIEVLLDDGVLSIRGEKKSESQDPGKGRKLSECYYGRFERDLTLPAEVQEDKVSAAFDKGVLTITLPKSEQARQRARRIEIAGADATPH
jgi:HSP20 family protein